MSAESNRRRVRSRPHRDGLESPPAASGRERRHRRSAGELVRAAGRGALWVLVAVVVVRGLGAIASGERTDPRPPVARPGRAAWPDGEARAFAERFARAYLTVTPGRPVGRERALEGFFAGNESVSDQTAMTPLRGPGAVVAWATVAREVPLGGSRAQITVATTSTIGTVRYLTVPIARDQAGGLSVIGPPALVAPPPRGTATRAEPEELTGPSAGPIRDLASRFLQAYLEGQSGAALGYFLAPQARLVQMPPGLRVVEVGGVARDPHPPGRTPGLAVQVAVRVRDQASGATYPFSYRLRVVRRERWYVAAVEGGSGA